MGLGGVGEGLGMHWDATKTTFFVPVFSSARGPEWGRAGPSGGWGGVGHALGCGRVEWGQVWPIRRVGLSGVGEGACVEIQLLSD